jgi:hypothetical protein
VSEENHIDDDPFSVYRNQFVRGMDDWRKKLRDFILEWYGPRCKDYASSCPTCQKWKAFDTLTHNPFE